MTVKERLEKVKEIYRWAIENSIANRIADSDIEWLIQQAERALKNAEDLEDMDKQLASEQRRIRELKEENQRYKQALEFGVKYLQNSNIRQIQLVVSALKQALEGKS